jgi:hypothetical protein
VPDEHGILQEAEDAPKEDRESNTQVIDEDDRRDEQKAENIEHRTKTSPV